MACSATYFYALIFSITGISHVFGSQSSRGPRLVLSAQERPAEQGGYLIPWLEPGMPSLSSLPPCCRFGFMENIDSLESPICGDFELGIFDNTFRIATPVFQNVTFKMNGCYPTIKDQAGVEDKRANVSLKIDFLDEYRHTLHTQIIRYWYGNVFISKGEKAPEVEIEATRDDGSMKMADLIVPTNGTLFMHLTHLQLVRDWIAKLEGMTDKDKKEERLDPTILLPLMNPVLRATKCFITLTSQEAQEEAQPPIVREKKWTTGAKNEPFKKVLYRLMNHLFEQVRQDKEEIVAQRKRAQERGDHPTFAQEVETITNHYYKDKKEGESLTPEEKERMTYDILQANEREKKWKEEDEKIKQKNLKQQKLEELWRKRTEDF